VTRPNRGDRDREEVNWASRWIWFVRTRETAEGVDLREADGDWRTDELVKRAIEGLVLDAPSLQMAALLKRPG